MRIRFHLDEHLGRAVAGGLRLRGIEVTTTAEAGLIGASDEAQLSFARTGGRAVVTLDDDLLRLAAQGVPHAGIVYCNPRRRSVGRLVLGLVALWRTRTAEEMVGRVEYL